MAVESVNLTQNYEIEKRAAELLMANIDGDPLFDMFPPVYKEAWLVMWEIPQSPYGIMTPRGGDGEPTFLPPPGWKRYKVTPSYYGNYTAYGEMQLTEQRQIGTPNEPLDTDWMVMQGMSMLINAAITQIRYIIVQLLVYGFFDVRTVDGRISHADQVAEQRKLVPSVRWSDTTNADPILDLLTWQATMQRGTSTSFGTDSTLLMSTESINQLLLNAKIRANFRINAGDTPNNLEDINMILTGYGLPQIRRYDEGYFPTKASTESLANFVKFLEVGTAIWMGVRKDGDKVGQFQMTKNLMKETPLGPTVDSRTDLDADIGTDKFNEGIYALVNFKQTPPPSLRLDAGFNGGPALIRPYSVAGITWPQS